MSNLKHKVEIVSELLSEDFSCQCVLFLTGASGTQGKDSFVLPGNP